MAIENDERGTFLRFAKDFESLLDALEVVCVTDTQDVPTVSQKSRLDILGESDARLTLDRNVIVIVDPAEVIETQVADERRCFRRNSFHQAAIAADGINVVIKDIKARAVVTMSEPLLGNCHSHTRGDALPKRAGRRLHSRNPMVLRMPGSFAVELAKALNIIKSY